MKAAKLTIGFREWSKLPDFVEMINEEDEMVAYEIDNTTALLEQRLEKTAGDVSTGNIASVG